MKLWYYTLMAIRKHLFQDLQPYLCLEDICVYNQTPFPTKAQWISHISLEHSDKVSVEGFSCYICMEKLTAGVLQVTSHLARHLEEVSLTILPTSPESDDDIDDNDEPHSSGSPSIEISTEPIIEPETELHELPGGQVPTSSLLQNSSPATTTMATNWMPQTDGGAQMRGRPAQQSPIRTAMYTQIVNEPVPQGWQLGVPPQTRTEHAMDMYNPAPPILPPKACADVRVAFATHFSQIRRKTPNPW